MSELSLTTIVKNINTLTKQELGLKNGMMDVEKSVSNAVKAITSTKTINANYCPPTAPEQTPTESVSNAKKIINLTKTMNAF